MSRRATTRPQPSRRAFLAALPAAAVVGAGGVAAAPAPAKIAADVRNLTRIIRPILRELAKPNRRDSDAAQELLDLLRTYEAMTPQGRARVHQFISREAK